jgi:hypothetical protein
MHIEFPQDRVAGATENPDGAEARNQLMRENSQKYVDGFYQKPKAMRG